MTRNKKNIIILSMVLSAWAILILNMEVSIRQGIDGRVRKIHMPLYAKLSEFLLRDYEYQRLAKEITASCRTDEEKVRAIFDWTLENIKTDIPEGWHIVDDHILNIIIRGYGTPDQIADVFTTLCVYSGVRAFWDVVSKPDNSGHIILSFVKLKNGWSVFDLYRGVYFKNKGGEIANIKELMGGSVITNEGEGLSDCEVDYRAFITELKSVKMAKVTRAYRQMPLGRAEYWLRQKIGRRDTSQKGCVP